MFKIKKVKPLFTTVITTMHKYAVDETCGGVLISKQLKGAIKEYQTVVAIGTTVRDIKVGDTVMIDPSRYAVMKHKEGSLKDGIIKDNPVIKYNFDTVEINGKTYLILQDRDIKFIFEGEEVVETPSPLIHHDNSLIK